MRSNIFFRALACLMGLCSLIVSCREKPKTTNAIQQFEKTENNPELRWREEFNMLKNPQTGKIPKGIRQDELAEAATIPLKAELGLMEYNAYVSQGPNNLGGRSRAIAYDVRFNGTSNRIVLAGGVSGGMFRSTDGGQNWTRVSSLNDIHNVTCVAQDPRPGHQDTWYFGTGEALGNSASASSGASYFFGDGIFKSIDNGQTWNQLPNTALGSQFDWDSEFDFIGRIVVSPQNGQVYAAGINCILRSNNGGGTWSTDLGSLEGNIDGMADVTITGNGTVFAAIPGRGFAAADNQGIWKKEGVTWTRIAQGGTPSWFNGDDTLGRIVLALAPSNENLLYALYFNGKTFTCDAPTPEAELGLYNNTTGTWTDLSANLPDEVGCLAGNDPFAVQGGYDLAIAIKPDNPNVVFIGGTNAYRSTDGFSTQANTSRIGGYNSPSSYALYPNHHSDVHAFTFLPNNPNIMLCASDGGLHEGDISEPIVSWTLRNNNFTTFQYYYAAIDPTTGSDKYIGGLQDNGTHYRNAGSNAHIPVFGGDGVSVGISSNNSNHYVGSQRGNVYRRSANLANGFINATLTPTNLSSNRLFVTLFHLDPDNSTILYYADFNELHRNARADTVTGSTPAANRMEQITGVQTAIGNTNIRSFATSRGTYNSVASKLFIGTDNGKLFRLDDPRNSAAATMPIRINLGAGMPEGAIIGIGVNPRNTDTILAVYSNYGITNIWFCGNATSNSPTWTPIEGNVPLPSVRSALIVINHSKVEYYVGTSTGLYSTVELKGNATTWVKEGADVIGNAIVVDIKLRPSDNRMLVATHGNGLFVTDIVLPVQMGRFEGQIVHGKSQLYWETLTEINNKGFEVEKSADGRSFSYIGFVPGKGTVSLRTPYQFTDPAKTGRVQYYRLKQIDKDGKSKYSQVVKLTQDALPLQLVTVVNPMGTNLIFTLNDVPKKAVEIKLVDAAGRTVWRQTQSGRSSNVFNLNIHHLPNSVYTLWVQTEGMNETRRVIKQL